MTDDEIKALLYGVYQTLLLLHGMLSTQTVSLIALQEALRENREFEELYAKHFADVGSSPLKQGLDAAKQSIEMMLHSLEQQKNSN